MQILHNRPLDEIEKVFLTKEERAALQSIIQLPEELQKLVKDTTYLLDGTQFNSDITEAGYWHMGRRYPIVWLNSPTACRMHLDRLAANRLRLVFREPKLITKIPYDFARVLISKSF